jgi:integrase
LGRLEPSLRQLALKGRESSTTENYESYLRVHIEPHFGETPITQVTAEDVEEFLDGCLDSGLSVKSTLNYLGFLHGIFDFAVRKHWAQINPCDEVEKPERADADQEIRFLEQTELDALLRGTQADRWPHKPATIERATPVRQLRDIEGRPWKEIAAEVGCAESTAIYLYRRDTHLRLEDDLARVERVLYLTAAMSGLRQRELLALRWTDIDWLAQRIRARRNFVRGKFGTSKSKRSSRSVPLADVVAAELEGSLSSAIAHRKAAGPVAAAQALQARPEAGGRARSSIPRLEAYVRYPDGCRRRANADAPGVDGPPRLQDDADLRRLRAGGERGRARQCGLRAQGHQEGIRLSASGHQLDHENPEEIRV